MPSVFRSCASYSYSQHQHRYKNIKMSRTKLFTPTDSLRSPVIMPSKLNVYNPCNVISQGRMNSNEDIQKILLMQYGGIGYDVVKSTLPHLQSRPKEIIMVVAHGCGVTKEDVQRIWNRLDVVVNDRNGMKWAKGVRGLAQKFKREPVCAAVAPISDEKTRFFGSIGLVPGNNKSICFLYPEIIVPEREKLLAEMSQRPIQRQLYLLPKAIQAMRGEFSCETCGKAFRELTSLNQHKTLHSGKTLITTGYRTVKRADGLFHCPHATCKKKYRTDQSLRVHLESVHGPPLLCRVCQQQLGCKASLPRHIQLMHPPNSFDPSGHTRKITEKLVNTETNQKVTPYAPDKTTESE